MNSKFVRASRRAILSASVIAFAAIPATSFAAPANPPCDDDDAYLCRIVVTETAHGIYTDRPTYIVNSGTITYGINRGTSDIISVVNQAGGTIGGIDAIDHGAPGYQPAPFALAKLSWARRWQGVSATM